MTFEHKSTHFFAENTIFHLKSTKKARKMYFFCGKAKKYSEKFGRMKKS